MLPRRERTNFFGSTAFVVGITREYVFKVSLNSSV